MDSLNGVYIGTNGIQLNAVRESFKEAEIKDFTVGSKSMLYFAKNKIDFIIIEITAVDKSIKRFLALLRAAAKIRDLVIILMVRKENISANSVYLSLGADDIYSLLTSGDVIKKRIMKLIELKERTAHHKTASHKFKFRIPIVKRVFDILVASTALIVLSPVFLVTAILIKRESKGPVFYSSKRVGTGFRIFNFYKFRSMDLNADKRIHEFKNLNQYASQNAVTKKTAQGINIKHPLVTEDGYLVNDKGIITEEKFIQSKLTDVDVSFVKIKDDPRVTKVGRFIRNTSIDELPQLINVLKGDMSIVGNRPIPLYEAEMLTTDQWIERFIAPAGLTGLWQVEKRAKSEEMSPDERKMLDNEYARSYTFWKDIQIIFRTFRALFQSESV
ncbi:MAG: sugar transferase [Bacteroidales bacterium]|nr:sugar transferase [Bacteroidales bacterium]MCF8405605.1 sugar transferase [Bacteroidales bacterium]